MTQTPAPGGFLLMWKGDVLSVELRLDSPRNGRAAFRTNIGRADVRRREIIAETERGETPLARAWTDIPLAETSPGVFSAEIPLGEVGVFSGKACFFPGESNVPEWPDGSNLHVKVESALTRKNNSIYTVFPRQFGSFREVARRLPFIMDKMGFRIVQTLPPFPVPTTYAVMGEYGCPFAALDFFSVDPAMAEFDPRATPLDQFRELIDAVHSRKGSIFLDLPANHTGWASALQTHHPEWFRRDGDGRFASPGAWGVVWEDLVELDYSHPGLRSYMAGVFLFWCRNGVDGFRCDAGYMIPAETWEYIVARVRDEYPDTVFMLEGLGGDLAVTDRLLAESNLDWAYSEIFQTYDRRAFEWYLPQAAARGEKYGTLVHFAETHDNDRLAKGGEIYARLRVQLAALLSWHGAWGIANGVEWYCTEKIDVHGKNGLNWGAERNMVDLIARLNSILDADPSFSESAHLEVVTRGGGNTLAVLRSSASGRTLVLANLDCEAAADVEWDVSRFGAVRAFDLVSEKAVDLASPLHLAPGQVMCLRGNPLRAVAVESVHREAPFHWSYPRDVRREVVVPQNELLEISAGFHFRMGVADPATGRTLAVCRSREDSSGRNVAYFAAPRYEGDGSMCRRLEIDMAVYEPDCPRHVKSVLLIPPPVAEARMKIVLSGDEVRRHGEWRTVLSNGSGAASQIRIGWGLVQSQYDAFLAANPDANCPSDRLNLWARTRCWLQREGYARELNCRCVTAFEADPAGRFAKWDFTVPCGMGKTASFVFEVSLVPEENAAVLRVERTPGGADDVCAPVRLVFRPDIEWRSFHSVTKAYAGLDNLFPQSVAPRADGFRFSPYDGVFDMAVEGGEYHHEPQWTYNVPHPEEAARGQDGAGDLFSPGWISADLEIFGTCVMEGRYLAAAECAGAFGESAFGDGRANTTEEFASLSDALRRSLDLFIVRRDGLKTAIAGYPWFLDWGRDTFIFMRGMIAAGRIADSLKILKAFAAFEENGTLPNIIYGKSAGNRDTADAQLWFVRCVQEIEPFVAKNESERLKKTCESIVDNYFKGTPNGIKVDGDSALVWSPSHFTWMDTNYPAYTPRAGYPVEIEALWVSALKYLGHEQEAQKAVNSTVEFFKRPDGNGYWDCLAAPGGERAADARPEDTIRPNQLFLVTLGVLDDKAIVRAVEELLVPGGVRSLNAENPLYRGVYQGDEDSSRKPAYHNGTVWAWPFPSYAEALVMTGLASKETALSLLAGAVDNLNAGCLCHLSEIADGDAPHAQKGCTAQAWSDSELLRVWLKLEANG